MTLIVRIVFGVDDELACWQVMNRGGKWI